MNTNDALLTKMIQKDMQSKGITDYTLSDKVVENAKSIEVGANEAVYIYYVFIKSKQGFKTQIKSATQIQSYDHRNTYNYWESTLITAHWSTVFIEQLTATIPHNYFIRYVHIIFNPNT